jgi:hypothetical protein
MSTRSAEVAGTGTVVAQETVRMSRHLIRGAVGGSTGRDQAADRLRRKGSTSALSGHVDYVDLAERMGQGVTVTNVDEDLPKSRRHKPHRRT